MERSKRSSADSLPTVLVDLDSHQPDRQELVRRISLALTTAGITVFTTDEKAPAARPVDVVISDRSDALGRLSAAELGSTETAPAAAAVGLVLLGSVAENADAHLPFDATKREIAQVCRLVGRIVALRRRSLEVEQKSDALARLAAIDPLTRVANRRTWDEQAFKRFRRALGAGQEVCLAIFDVDHFKAINDTRGHATGDAALAAMGDDFGGLMRAGDLLARLGGDEFAALLVGKFDTPGPLAIVERIRAGVGRRQTARLGFELSLSAGCALIGPGEATTPAEAGGAGGPVCRGRCRFAAGEKRRPGSDRAGQGKPDRLRTANRWPPIQPPPRLSILPRRHPALHAAGQPLNAQEAFGVGLVVGAAAFHRGDALVVQAVGLSRPATMMLPL